MTLRGHFDIRQWVDFVRGIDGNVGQSAMQEHLERCARCARAVRVLRGFAEYAAAQASSEPAADVLRRAQAIFPARGSAAPVFARLVYDSFRQPLAAGVRAQDLPARHALYEAANVCVDLRLEHEPESGLMTLMGQIADREQPRANTTTRPVLLMAAKGLVASARCNRLGEFEMTYRPARNLRLHVPLGEEGGHVEVRMDELSPLQRTRAPRARKPGPPIARRRSQQ